VQTMAAGSMNLELGVLARQCEKTNASQENDGRWFERTTAVGLRGGATVIQ